MTSQRGRKKEKIYNKKKLNVISETEKPDTRAEFHPEAFEVIGYNKNHGEITTFGMKMSTETTQTRISL